MNPSPVIIGDCQLYLGDCLSVMTAMPPDSIDTIITDPPYGLGFMGKAWDHGVPGIPFWQAALRVAKPAAMMLAFGGTRTFHRLTCAIEDAGWEIRDCLMWLYGSGFPKSLDISKAIDKAAGSKRETIGMNPNWRPAKTHGGAGFDKLGNGIAIMNLSTPATNLAKLWDGWGSALKPAWEPIILAMKPLDGTFAQNAERHGAAGLNIDGGRIGMETVGRGGANGFKHTHTALKRGGLGAGEPRPVSGRWPANLILDEEAAAMLDEQSGELPTGGSPKTANRGYTSKHSMFGRDVIGRAPPVVGHADSGGASRFFYCAKASRAERNAGPKGMPLGEPPASGRSMPAPGRQEPLGQKRENHHPTVKPLALMEYLCRLTMTPTGGIVLDPFAGSGSTCIAAKRVGRPSIGIEICPEYFDIACKRIETELTQKEGRGPLWNDKLKLAEINK